MRGNERFVKEHVKHVNPSFIVLDSIVEPLEFLSINLNLTQHQIGIRQKIILTSSTPHASKVFTTPIMTFEEISNQ
jgi:hypothetical protein